MFPGAQLPAAILVTIDSAMPARTWHALHRGACCTAVTWGTAILKRLGQHAGTAIREGRSHEQARWRPGFRAIPCTRQVGILRRLLAFLAKVLASPNGDQDGWEGGARVL